MNCNTTFAILPIGPSLPRGLAVLVLVSLLLQSSPVAFAASERLWPPVTTLPAPAWKYIRCRLRRITRRIRRAGALAFIGHSLARCFVRCALLAGLLHVSGWSHALPLSWSILIVPPSQMVFQCLAFILPQPQRVLIQSKWLERVQRLYQITLILLLLSAAVQFLGQVAQSSGRWLGPLLLSTWVTQPDDETEMSVKLTGKDQYAVTLRGTFTFVWETRDTFEFWMLALFLRRLYRPGARKPVLNQRQVAAALACHQAEVSQWERAVREHSWHILSDRYRHQLQSVLPKPELSRAILKTWVPCFWLSAWDVRERLIVQGAIPNREALDDESLHTLAKHTGFNLVRDFLLERFDLQAGVLIAREHWWLKELVALNERLIAKLERGERLTPQELVDIEPVRLQTPEKQPFPARPPVVAHLTATLLPRPTAETSASIRCTYCGSDRSAPRANSRVSNQCLTNSVKRTKFQCCATIAKIPTVPIKPSPTCPQVLHHIPVIHCACDCSRWKSMNNCFRPIVAVRGCLR